MKQELINKMEEVYQNNSNIGRNKLADLAGCTTYAAQVFLAEKHKGQPVNHHPHHTGAKIDPATKHIDIGLSQFEIEIVKQGMKIPQVAAASFEWSQESFKFAHVTDTHMGHKLSRLDWWQRACDLIEKEGCQFVCHTGDMTEGMNKRIPGHIYELEAIGSTAQVELAENRLKLLPCDIYAINGNHDLWGYSSIGFDPCHDIAKGLPDKFHYLGMHEADLKIGNIMIKFWHGEDGSSYATSYRTQKFIENLSGGEKPHILLAGHDHKEIAYTCRNVRVFGGGTLCGQTRWMRNKKLAAHVGFRIIEVWQNENGIERIKEEWIPFFI